MKRMTLALGALVLALTAAAPAPVNAGWLLIRWSDGWCQIWDDFNANAKPIGPGWTQLNPRPYPTWEMGYAEWVKFTRKPTEPKCRPW